MNPTAYDDTTTSGTQPWKIETTMGKIDASDLMIYKYNLSITQKWMGQFNK